MVEMRMHGRDRQVVVVMLQRRQALGQIARVVVVDIREVGDAMPRAAGRRALACGFEMLAQQIPDRFRAVLVAAPLDQRVELARQRLVQRNGDSFHILPP